MADEPDLIDQWLSEDDEDETSEVVAAADSVVDPDPSPSDEPALEPAEADRADSGDRGDGRDARGRFAGKGEAAAGADAAPVAGDTAQPVAEGAPPAAEVVEEAPEQPFVFKAMEQDWEIPGAKVTKDGQLVIPKESRELVESFLGKGVKLEAERAEIKRERLQARQEAELARAKSQAFGGEVQRLFEIAQLQDDQQFAEAMLAYGLELRAALPTLQKEMELSEREARLQMQAALAQPDPVEQRELIDRQIGENIVETIGQLRQLPDLNALTERDWGELQALMQAEKTRFYYRAGPNLSAEERAAGIEPGQIVLDGHRLLAEARRIQAIRADAKAEAERARKAFEDAKKVAEQNAKKIAAAQPAPAAPTKTKSPAKGTRQAVTRDEEEDDFSLSALMKEFESTLSGR